MSSGLKMNVTNMKTALNLAMPPAPTAETGIVHISTAAGNVAMKAQTQVTAWTAVTRNVRISMMRGTIAAMMADHTNAYSATASGAFYTRRMKMTAVNETKLNARTARIETSAVPGPTQKKMMRMTPKETKRKLINRMPKVLLSAEAEKQLRVWTQAAQGEFSCFGVTEVDKDSGAIVVKEFFLPEQTCTDSHTSPDRESMGALMTELVKAGYDVSDLRCWAHSHADMECFWSSEDSETVDQMDNDDWLLSIVTNKAGHFRARLDLYKPWRITVDQIKVGFLASVEHDKALEAELKDKVSNGKNSMFDWPNRQAPADIGMDDYSYLGPDDCIIDDIFADLQLVGVSPEKAEELLSEVDNWSGSDVDEFWPLLDRVLGDDSQAVDPWSVIQVLGEYGYFPADIEADHV